MVIRRFTAFLIAPLFSQSQPHIFAHSERGSITGVVQDTTKGAIPGVAVNVVHGHECEERVRLVRVGRVQEAGLVGEL